MVESPGEIVAIDVNSNFVSLMNITVYRAGNRRFTQLAFREVQYVIARYIIDVHGHISMIVDEYCFAALSGEAIANAIGARDRHMNIRLNR